MESKSKNKLMSDERFRALYAAICASELGASVPPIICREIAEFGHILLDSSLLTAEEEGYLIGMIESQSQTEQFKGAEWNLLCRYSRDGVDAQYARAQELFHNTCDGKKHTVCLLDVKETGWICGGYASTEWKSTGSNTAAKDENAFLFVIRPAEKRKVFHRKRNGKGDLIQPDRGILYNRGDGFNFGYNDFFWGNNYRTFDQVSQIYTRNGSQYFDWDAAEELTGQKAHPNPHWTDFEVYQLNT